MLRDRSRRNYDRNEITKRAADVAAYYLGRPVDEGARLLWNCPACGKERKLALRKGDQLFGCFVDDCELHGSGAVFALIAREERLNLKTQFVEILRRGYEILGLENGSQSRRKAAKTRNVSRPAPNQKPKPSARDVKERLALCREVNARIMGLCPLEARDRRYLRVRGLSHETIRQGRFGSMSAERAQYVKKVLLEEFGEEKLLSVPGFSKEKPSGKLTFTFTGDYLLIPYHDREWNVTNIEGRTMGEIPKKMGKYVSLRGSGNHLYLFPTSASTPERIDAFTEGTFGAIVAAQCGIAVGSIQGCKRFMASPSSFAPDGEKGDSLPELKGVNFRGKTVPYIPDADDPPNTDVLNAAPRAAHHLIERQGGAATLCTLPRGMDLDEWLIDVPKEKRREEFRQLILTATPLERAEEWKRAQCATEEALVTEPGNGRKVYGRQRGHGPREAASNRASNTEAPQEDDVPQSVNTAGEIRRTANKGQDQFPITPDVQEGDGQATVGGEDREEGGGSSAQPENRGDGTTGRTSGARKLRDEIYRSLLGKCPPKDEHREALMRLGLMAEAIEVAGLGSLDPERTKHVAAEVQKEFGAKRLRVVPGFEQGHGGKVSLRIAGSSTGEHILLPCFDAEGLLAAVETLEYDAEAGEFTDPDKTLTLKGAGAHLYVFAPYSPEEIEGFCEGPLAAILAAQDDVVLGAIGHYKRYTADAGSAKNTEQVGAVLPELAGVDFAGRTLTYVPRLGPTEQSARAREAHNACRHLVERQNGVPEITFPRSTRDLAGAVPFETDTPESDTGTTAGRAAGEGTSEERAGSAGALSARVDSHARR